MKHNKRYLADMKVFVEHTGLSLVIILEQDLNDNSLYYSATFEGCTVVGGSSRGVGDSPNDAVIDYWRNIASKELHHTETIQDIKIMHTYTVPALVLT